MVLSKFRTTRCWSAPAGCRFINSPSTSRAATSHSNLSSTLVSLNAGTRLVVLVNSTLFFVNLLRNFPFPSDPADEISLVRQASSADATEWSLEVMRTQYEWLFIDMTVTNKTVMPFGVKQDMIIYTVSIITYKDDF